MVSAMITPSAKPARPQITLSVERAAGVFEIRDGHRLVGALSSEVTALLTAVEAAKSLAKCGSSVRVVAVRSGNEFPEFVAVSFAEATAVLMRRDSSNANRR
jgi:hypothetical protein